MDGLSVRHIQEKPDSRYLIEKFFINVKDIPRSNPQYHAVDDADVMALSEMFARRCAGRHNKNVIFLLVGEMGSGKSMVLLELARKTAVHLAKLIGGKPEDYFTFNNVGVINPESLWDKLSELKPFNIYILDDAGVGWDARDFAKEGNKELNHILSTCRVHNNCIFMSVPDTFLIDKAPRTISYYYGEVSESMHGYGLTFIKVFRLKRLFRQGKTLYRYLSKGASKIIRYKATMPPKELVDQYNVVRDREACRVREKAAEKRNPPPKKEKEGVLVSCHRCGHTWTYTGKRKYTTCSSCRTQVAIDGLLSSSQ